MQSHILHYPIIWDPKAEVERAERGRESALRTVPSVDPGAAGSKWKSRFCGGCRDHKDLVDNVLAFHLAEISFSVQSRLHPCRSCVAMVECSTLARGSHLDLSSGSSHTGC